MMDNVRRLDESVTEILTLTSRLLSLSVRIMSLAFAILLQLFFVSVALIGICWFFIKCLMKLVRRGEAGKVHVAFFHPYCNAGGGGERVLWSAIRAIQRKYSNVKCYVYTGDTDATSEEILRKAHDRFNITLPEPVEMIYLRSRTLMEARHYPIFTLLMQSIGSFALSLEAIITFCPDIYVDTLGCAFTYPTFKLMGGCHVISYTHYPTITTDMLQRVMDRVEAHNNRSLIARNFVLTLGKLCYYHIFAFMYSIVGRFANVIMVNSTWTYNHITSLWGQAHKTHIIYPPCDTEKFKSLPVLPDWQKKLKSIVSIGQFRPEKDHTLQLKAFKRLCEILSPEAANFVELVLIGGCRNEEDQQRVQELKNLASSLGIEDKLVWKLNAPFSELLENVENGTIGLHTMWCEHFGICVVECMAGGLIMVAHDSGGPKMDIVTDYEGQRTGYRATDEESYAQAMKTIIESSPEDRDSIRTAAKSSVDRFSEAQFEVSFLSVCGSIFSSVAIER